MSLSLTTACAGEPPTDHATGALAVDSISLVARPAFDQWIGMSPVCAPPNQSTPIDLSCPVKVQGKEKGRLSVRRAPEIPRAPGAPWPPTDQTFVCVVACQVKDGDVELLDPGAPNNPATSVPFNSCTQLGTYAGVMQEILDALKNLKLIGEVIQRSYVKVPVAIRDHEAALKKARALCLEKIDLDTICKNAVVVPAVIPTIGCFLPPPPPPGDGSDLAGSGSGIDAGTGSGSGSGIDAGTGSGIDAGTGSGSAAIDAGTGIDAGSGSGSWL